ncbi:hypothetical protein EUX98_g5605 [Antrodiella citrinella]|uniref:Autophagy-related protein 16 domain-containing protein n=1 Tax=Antrodiella citrinella TaxID=2447956 RepID=A0A4S4MR20_9APHY|nr:hypothetical protein EUX98_g5605 [Antrodiella citrinella]
MGFRNLRHHIPTFQATLDVDVSEANDLPPSESPAFATNRISELEELLAGNQALLAETQALKDASDIIFRDRVDEQDKEIQRLRTQVSGQVAEGERVQSQVATLQDEVATHVKDKELLQTEVSTHVKEIAQLQGMLSWYEQELRHSKEAFALQAKELSEMSAQNVQYKNEVEAIIGMVDQLKQRRGGGPGKSGSD